MTIQVREERYGRPTDAKSTCRTRSKLSVTLEDAGNLAFVREDGGEHPSMGMAYIFNEGSERGLLQRGLFFLASVG